jgi:hypothetical protein
MNIIQLIEMRYTRTVKCLSVLNHVRNEDITKEPKIQSV